MDREENIEIPKEEVEAVQEELLRRYPNILKRREESKDAEDCGEG